MRLTVLFSVMILSVFSSFSSQASSFNSSKFIDDCIQSNVSTRLGQQCLGYFYGLASKIEFLLDEHETNDLLNRAKTNRVVSSNYGNLKQRRLGIEKLCLPNDLSLNTFQQAIWTFQTNTQKRDLNLQDVSDIFAQRFACKA